MIPTFYGLTRKIQPSAKFKVVNLEEINTQFTSLNHAENNIRRIYQAQEAISVRWCLYGIQGFSKVEG